MQTTIETADRWWSTAPNEIKALFLGISNQPAAQERYDEFWQSLHPCDKNYIFWFCQAKSGAVEITEDDLQTLVKEIVCELADIALEKQYGLPREEMCDEDGSYLEEYQDRFNKLYDAIEARFVDFEWELNTNQ